MRQADMIKETEINLLKSKLQYSSSLDPIKINFIDKLEIEGQKRFPARSHQDLANEIVHIIEDVYNTSNLAV